MNCPGLPRRRTPQGRSQGLSDHRRGPYRPEEKPVFYDEKFPGLYNARRDNLERFWANLFGRRHAVVLLESFFENVKRHDMEGRPLAPGEKPENIVLQFSPEPASPMWVACLWSHWAHPDEGELR